MTIKKDKRVKLTPAQKNEIIIKNSEGVTAYRLAKEYGVSAMLIHYILNPEKLENNRKNEQSKTGYPEKNRIRQEKFRLKNKQ